MTKSKKETEKPKLMVLFISKNDLPLYDRSGEEWLLYFTPNFVESYRVLFPKKGEVLSGKKLKKVLCSMISGINAFCHVEDKDYTEALIAETQKTKNDRPTMDKGGKGHEDVHLINSKSRILEMAFMIEEEELYTIIEVVVE